MAAKGTGKGDVGACSFCGRSRQQVDTLIQGPDVAICDHCVRLCAEIVLERSYVTCFYCGTRAYQTDSYHVDAVHGICNACASALGRQPDRATDPLRAGTLSEPERLCSFCEKNHRDARHLIAGPEVNICDECVHSCVARIAGSSPPPVNIE